MIEGVRGRRMARLMPVLAIPTLAVAAFLAGCTPPPAPAPTAPASGTQTVPASAPVPVTSAPVPTTAPATPAVADGKHPVLIKGIDPGAGTLTVDVVELYLGAAADTQWQIDHPGQQVPPLDGHYMRDKHPNDLYTVAVSPSAVIHVIPGGDPLHPNTITFSAFASYAPQHGVPYWITVQGGVITLIEQQFIA
jgi:hypothetical protein